MTDTAVLTGMKNNISLKSGFIKSILIILFLYFIPGCPKNPATGERQFNIVSTAQEIELGKESDQQISESFGLYNDPALAEYVSRLGKELAAKSERPDLPWTFRVLDDPVVNAFALPGGFIYVTRGILSHLNSEAELTGVLGHEIGHVTAKHSANMISQAQLAQLGLGVAAILKPDLYQKYGQFANIGIQLLFLKFGRDDEKEADWLGVRYMLRENYNPEALKSVMSTLDKVSSQAGAGGVPEWLSTHPSPGNRIELIQESIDTMSQNTASLQVNREEFVNRINQIIYGEDPREGYFKGTTFYHPELKFQFGFPSGWKTLNQKAAVIGISPNQDAAIQITLSGQKSLQAAANEFFRQEGLNAGQLNSLNINNLPVVWGEFTAATQQGNVQGASYFIQHGGNIYQVLGYTAQQSWSQYQSSITGALNTFNQLNDPNYLSVEPKKINIVTINKAMTLQEFYNSYPSTVPIESIALINQAEPGTQFQAGHKLKQVTGGKIP